MSLKNFDISYGFNGDPSTASLSFVFKKKTCGNFETQPSIGTFGGSAITGNSVIDDLVKNFVINEIKTSKEAGFKTVSYELIDREAKRLEAIAVLVRGITAPEKGSDLNSFSASYNNSELSVSPDDWADYQTMILGRIAIIGRKYSQISVSVGGGAPMTVSYSRGEEKHKSQSYVYTLSRMLGDAANPEIKYGYYLSDLKDLLIQYGYVLNNFPTDNELILMDFGGSLKEVVSSVAAMYGQYWMCRGNVITFFDSSKLLELSVPNFNEDTDPNILSSNYSEDILGKSSVGVIVGKGKIDLGGKETNEDSGETTYDTKGMRVNFYLVSDDVYGVNGKLLSAFYSFFKFSNDGSAFDRVVFSAMAFGVGGDINVENSAIFQNYYQGGTIKRENGNLKILAISEIDKNETRQDQLQDGLAELKNYTSFIALENDYGQNLLLPSKSALFSVLGSAAEAIGSIYISRPVSSNIKDNYSLQQTDGLSVSGPYIGSSKLDSIQELRPAFDAIGKTQEEKQNLTLSQLYRAARGQKPQAESVLDPLTSYYYVGVKDPLNGLKEEENASLREASAAVDEAIQKSASEVVNPSGNKQYLAFNNTRKLAISNMFSKSINLIKTVIKKEKEVIAAEAIKSKEEDSSSGGGSSQNPDGLGLGSEFEWQSFSIRQSDGNDLSAVNIMKFDGTVGETEFLESQFSRIVSPAFYPKSSSVTYSGLNLPEDNPLLSSVSVSFAGGVIETSLSYSNKEFIAESDSVIMADYKVGLTKNLNKKFKTRQRNFFGI